MTLSNGSFGRAYSPLAVTKDDLRTMTMIAPFQARPLLADVLDEIGPLPKESLFLGKAEDGLPVLLNYQDPRPGPILILGNPNSGKTDFLRVIAQSAISTYTPAEIQFVVLTERTEEWDERLANSPHCIGVFASHNSHAIRLVQSLAAWLSIVRSPRQSVLLFIDGLEYVLARNPEIVSCLQRIFTYGPQKRVWPFVTLTPLHIVKLDAWLGYFQSRILGNDSALPGNTSPVNSSPSVNAPWFSLEENGRRIRFWVPALGD